MFIEAVDHVVVPVPSLEAAAAPFEQLGLVLTPPTRHRGRGTENRVFFVGSGPNDFYVELLGVHHRASARQLYLDTIDRGGGTIALLMLAVNDIHGAVEALARHRVRTAVERVSREDGTPICDVATLDDIHALGFAAGLIQYVEPREAAHARRVAAGQFDHSFPLKRLDHLAAMTTDLEASTRFWVEVMGVPVHGEVRAPGIIIRQLKMGDAILEVLAADGPESRLAGRPPGLANMCAFEVEDLDAAVALARVRGFNPSEPAKGILPGTRTATIPGAELGGMALQLLAYV